MSRMIHLRFLGLFVVMLTMFNMSALATSTYYSKATATAVGNGKVYVSDSNTTPSTYNNTSSSKSQSSETTSEPTHTYYLYAQANEGAEFMGWYNNADCTGSALSTNKVEIKAESKKENQPTTKNYYALFQPFFKFSATAEKIYDHGRVTATVANSKIVGAKDDTSASTTATFTAEPNPGCTFEGWYTDLAHKNRVSTNTTYTTTITNSKAGSTEELTLYAWFKKNQTLTWTNDYEPNVVVGTTSTGAATATVNSPLAVSYSTSDAGIATVNSSGDVTGVSVNVKKVTVTASQPGNDEYNAATPITRDFTVISKYAAEFEFKVNGTIVPNEGNATLYVDDTETITLKYVDSDFIPHSSDETVVHIAQDGNVVTLTALKVGISTITLTQPNNTTHSLASATYNITVAKVSNTLAVSLASQSAEVDGSIAVTFSGQNNTGTAIVGTITEETQSSTVNNGTNVITYANGVITACNAGTAKITFTQAATDKYEGFTSSTYTITVTKKSNPITITLAGGSSTNIKLKYGATATLSYSSEHSETEITVKRVEGNYTTHNDADGTIKAGNTQGTDVYEIRQAETYNYDSGYASFTIRVNNTDEEIGYVYTGWTDGSDYSWWTTGGPDPLPLSGPGDVLSFDAKRQTGGGNYFFVLYSTDDGKTWDQLDNPNLTTSFKNYSDTLPENKNITHIKFETRTGATLQKWIKNIYVTRRTYVKASPTTTSFGTVYTDVTPKPKETFTVNYSTTNGGNVVVSSNNNHFVVSSTDFVQNKTEFATTNHSHGTKTFTVTYTPDPNQLGAESAVITVGDLFYSQQITLTATAAKRANTLAVIGTQNLKVGGSVSNVYSDKNSTATLNYALSPPEGVITYDPTNKKITAVGAGNATLTLWQAPNDYYLGTSKTIEVNVSKYDDQVVSWDNALSDEERILEVGAVLTTNTATSNKGLTVTYSSSNPDVLAVASDGTLTALSGGSNIANVVITATAGNYMYEEVSITRSFTVIKRVNPTVYTTLSETGTNYFPLAGDDITIRCDATVTESSFDITGNSEGYVSASFASNTLTIRALKEGGPVTVTLTRPQDLGFYALNKSYTIQVVKPALALEPTADPVINYATYSRVTLNRTLPEGFSTLALPFATNVATLTGRSNSDDWVAQLKTVTHTQVDAGTNDEYTLYFQKVDGGAIAANQPYVLHLADEVVNPTWTDLTTGISVTAIPDTPVASSLTLTGYSGCTTDWGMYANYVVDFPMDGKYGIVNTEGGLMRGSGSGAKLRAFTAYITGPAPTAPNLAPRLRVAYVDPDGTTTVVEGFYPDTHDSQGEPVAIYGPDGQRRSRLQRGVNIVRYSDGGVKRVQY